jgi:hypothetical protein
MVMSQDQNMLGGWKAGRLGSYKLEGMKVF